MWHVWGTGELYTEFWWGKLMERNYLEDLGVDGRIILNCILMKSVGKVWTGLNGSGQGQVASFCDRGNGTLGQLLD